jgi:hypothetical protein
MTQEDHAADAQAMKNLSNEEERALEEAAQKKKSKKKPYMVSIYCRD